MHAEGTAPEPLHTDDDRFPSRCRVTAIVVPRRPVGPRHLGHVGGIDDASSAPIRTAPPSTGQRSLWLLFPPPTMPRL